MVRARNEHREVCQEYTISALLITPAISPPAFYTFLTSFMVTAFFKFLISRPFLLILQFSMEIKKDGRSGYAAGIEVVFNGTIFTSDLSLFFPNPNFFLQFPLDAP